MKRTLRWLRRSRELKEVKFHKIGNCRNRNRKESYIRLEDQGETILKKIKYYKV